MSFSIFKKVQTSRSHFALLEHLLLFPAQSTNVGHFLAIIIIKT